VVYRLSIKLVTGAVASWLRVAALREAHNLRRETQKTKRREETGRPHAPRTSGWRFFLAPDPTPAGPGVRLEPTRTASPRMAADVARRGHARSRQIHRRQTKKRRAGRTPLGGGSSSPRIPSPEGPGTPGLSGVGSGGVVFVELSPCIWVGPDLATDPELAARLREAVRAALDCLHERCSLRHR
jgi:hypothetical protein